MRSKLLSTFAQCQLSSPVGCSLLCSVFFLFSAITTDKQICVENRTSVAFFYDSFIELDKFVSETSFFFLTKQFFNRTTVRLIVEFYFLTDVTLDRAEKSSTIDVQLVQNADQWRQKYSHKNAALHRIVSNQLEYGSKPGTFDMQ